MLTFYQQTTQRLLRDEKTERFNLFDLTDWINVARGQVAGEGECVRVQATIATVADQITYPFTGITVSGSPGVQSVLSVRMMTGPNGLLTPREWEWFNLYYVPSPSPAAPAEWCQYAQGALGSIVVNPPPSVVVSLIADTVCLPTPLATDATIEAIPYPWTDAVPYYAAYQAYLTAQDAVNAKNMLDIYGVFMQRARGMATPTVLPRQYEMGHPGLPPQLQPTGA